MDDKTNNKNIIINQLKQSSKNEEFMFIKKNKEDSNDNGINKNNSGEKILIFHQIIAILIINQYSRKKG